VEGEGGEALGLEVQEEALPKAQRRQGRRLFLQGEKPSSGKPRLEEGLPPGEKLVKGSRPGQGQKEVLGRVQPAPELGQGAKRAEEALP
jgi:hypothetical protein